MLSAEVLCYAESATLACLRHSLIKYVNYGNVNFAIKLLKISLNYKAIHGRVKRA